LGNAIRNLGAAAFQTEEMAAIDGLKALAVEEARGVLDRSQAIRASGQNDSVLNNIEARMRAVIRRLGPREERGATAFGSLNQFRVGGRSICSCACVEFIL